MTVELKAEQQTDHPRAKGQATIPHARLTHLHQEIGERASMIEQLAVLFRDDHRLFITYHFIIISIHMYERLFCTAM